MTDGQEVTAEDCLIVFLKLPTKGNVKTRLAQKVGPEIAAALYRTFVADTLRIVSQSNYEALVFFYPPESLRAITDWLGEEMTLLPQEGSDLGERMLKAFRVTFQKASRAVLIGSDCPDLSPIVLNQAFEALKTHGAVIGPAEDGGYYLIGLNAEACTDVPFKGIEWGSASVFEDTMEAFGESGVSVCVLPVWHDVDDYNDLKAFYERQRAAPPGNFSTIDFLREHLQW